MEEKKVVLVISVEQASALAEAVELLARLGFGQLESVEHLVSTGHIPMRSSQESRSVADQDVCESVNELMMSTKKLLGFNNSSSYGPTHSHVNTVSKRSWELYKAVAQVMAVERNPRPEMPGCDYEGLSYRILDEQAPMVRMINEAQAKAMGIDFNDDGGS